MIPPFQVKSGMIFLDLDYSPFCYLVPRVGDGFQSLFMKSEIRKHKELFKM